MQNLFAEIFQNAGIAEEIRTDIERAWDQKITENRNQVTTQLREEFASKYEHDKGLIVEAMDKLLSDTLKEEIAGFLEDKKQLSEQKARYAIKMKRDSELMREFISRQLAQEVSDLHKDHNNIVNKFHKLEEFVVEALANEVSEFYHDKEDIVKTKVKLVKEGKQALKHLKEKLVRHSATLVEEAVSKMLVSEINHLKEDIEIARKQEFGRKVFEAFASEYQTSYLNENAETTKLLKMLDRKNQEVMEAKSRVSDAIALIEQKDTQVKKLMESTKRQEIMHELISPLAADQRGIMKELLESVQTSKLRDSFDKYLPSVISGTQPSTKKILSESVVTGNKVGNTISSEPDANIIDIRRLAGIKQ
jgi:ribosomal protein S17E